MKGFEVRDGAAVAHLDEDERAVIARVVADVGLLLGAESFGMPQAPTDDEDDELFRHLKGLEESLSDPDDPAVLRVLPNAAPTDRDVAAEFRRLTEPELRSLKIDRLRRMWNALSGESPQWVVPLDEVMPTAAALTDLRLVLATRLELDSDADAIALHEEIALTHHAVATDAAADLRVDPERVWLGMLYETLTWLQESLLSAREDDDA